MKTVTISTNEPEDRFNMTSEESERLVYVLEFIRSLHLCLVGGLVPIGHVKNIGGKDDED